MAPSTAWRVEDRTATCCTMNARVQLAVVTRWHNQYKRQTTTHMLTNPRSPTRACVNNSAVTSIKSYRFMPILLFQGIDNHINYSSLRYQIYIVKSFVSTDQFIWNCFRKHCECKSHVYYDVNLHEVDTRVFCMTKAR